MLQEGFENRRIKLQMTMRPEPQTPQAAPPSMGSLHVAAVVYLLFNLYEASAILYRVPKVDAVDQLIRMGAYALMYIAGGLCALYLIRSVVRMNALLVNVPLVRPTRIFSPFVALTATGGSLVFLELLRLLGAIEWQVPYEQGMFLLCLGICCEDACAFLERLMATARYENAVVKVDYDRRLHKALFIGIVISILGSVLGYIATLVPRGLGLHTEYKSLVAVSIF